MIRPDLTLYGWRGVEIQEPTNQFENIFADGFRPGDGVGAAAATWQSDCKPNTCRLPDNSSDFTAELPAILLAL